MVSKRATVFCALQTMQQLAHHFLVTLFHVENVANSCAELSTFNPLFVGSTPARPTKIKLKTPRKKVRGVFLCPYSTSKTLCQHFIFHAVRRRC